MRLRTVAAILRKDLTAFLRDRFFVFMTLLGLAAYVGMFYVLPSTVDETITLGVSAPGIPGFDRMPAGRGVDIVEFDTPDALRDAIVEGTDGVAAGIVFPGGFLDDVASGEATSVELYVPADLPAEVRGLLDGLVGEIAFAVSGRLPPVDPLTDAVVLGEDRVGDQISFREQIRPLLAFFVLMVETFALASLVASEVQQRTVAAVLVTPATTTDFLAAKGILGTGLAFGEAVLLMILVGGLAAAPGIMLVALLLGAVLVTGLGMVAGTYGRDFIGVLFWSMAFMIPLMIPAFGALFPGAPATWIQALPTHGLVEVVVGVTTTTAGWADVAGDLAVLAGWGAAAFAAGALILRRRVVTL